MENIELDKFVASWRRQGLPEERIAQLKARFIRLADNADDDDETWHVQRAEEPHDDDEPADEEEDPQSVEPTVSPEMQAAIAAGLQVMADTGNAPKKTRDIPRLMRPRIGRPTIDVNAPDVKRMLERFRPRSPSTASISRPVLVPESAHGSAGDRNCALASTIRLTMANRPKALRASRSMRVTVTTSPAARAWSSLSSSRRSLCAPVTFSR
jgi:hypothetical protein